MADATRRPTAIQLTRRSHLSYEATNARGGSVIVGDGNDADFTPVELLMAAIAGCTAISVDPITGRRCEPDRFEIDVTADRVKDDDGNRLGDIVATVALMFPETEDGDRARGLLDRAIRMAHDRLCTVSRTIELGTPVTMRRADGT